jgi:hypothetical protein
MGIEMMHLDQRVVLHGVCVGQNPPARDDEPRGRARHLRVWVGGSRGQALGLGFTVWGSGLGDQGLGLRVYGLG